MQFMKVFLVGATFVAVLHGPSVAQAESFLDSITLAEVKGGVWGHDLTKNNKHSNSIDLNLELAFENTRPFDFGNAALNFVLNPRAIIGVSINVEGDTHQAYLALDWRYQFENSIFVEASFGGVGHTGNLHQATIACPPGAGCALPGNRRFLDTGEPRLGTRVLFREHAEVGYRMDSGWSVSVFGAHISNAGLHEDNAGMDFVGLRVGFAFKH